jgi:hypothetical protein
MTANTTTLPEFSPPANLNDLTAENQKIWSDNYISQWMNDEIAGNEPGRTPLSQFFNGTVTAYDTSQTPAAITWTAFPNLVRKRFGDTTPLRWKVADSSRIFQDEYLEWSAARDDRGNISSATFTCEGPEYWKLLADSQPSTFLQLVRDLNSDFQNEFDDSDFFLVNESNSCKVYNPLNYWNFVTTTGTIAHLIQPNNTLSAEVDIAAQATVIRKDSDGNIITDSDKLIKCSQYGNPGRDSDPQIGSSINKLARGGNSISISDPVGIYIHSFATSTLQLDQKGTGGNDLVAIPDGTFTFTRGDISKNQGLRLKVKIPDGITGTGSKNNGKQLTVSDIYDTGSQKHIMYAAQLADYIKMTVAGVTISSSTVADAQPCMCDQPESSSSTVTTATAISGVKLGPGLPAGHTKAKVKPHLSRRG